MTARRANRLDMNQAEIVAALRKVPGVTVQSLACVGDGVPDLLVGLNGRNFLFEVKPPPNAHGRILKRWMLNANESEWHAMWRGQCAVVRTVDEALAVLAKFREWTP